MDEITKETVENAISTPDPMLEVLSNLLKTVAIEAVTGLASVLTMLGVDASTMPGQYFAQAMLVASDEVFQPISREEWVGCYDAYQQVKKVLEENPELREALVEKKAAAQADADATSSDPLLNGEF